MRKLIVGLAALGCSLGVAQAQPRKPGVEVGTLQCTVAGGAGLILGSVKDMSCRYNSSDGRISEPYEGTVTRVGLDIGVTGAAVIIWTVFAPTSSFRPGALEGTYAGIAAEATAGVGAGANVLVGGSDKTFTLQPVSVGAQTGLNLAVGIGSMRLVSPVR